MKEPRHDGKGVLKNLEETDKPQPTPGMAAV